MNAEILKTEQGSQEWLKLRLGVITASRAHDILPSKKGGGFNKSRQTYMNELVAEVCTGRGDEINAKALSWGKENEVAARAAYQFEASERIEDGGFVYGLDRRVGCSPDGIVTGKNKGLELKCPFSSETHIAFLTEDKIKDEYITQCQWSMWVAGFDVWAFASFDPRMKKHMIKIQVIERDPKMMALFDEIVPGFIEDMNKLLERLEIEYGSQWL
jgi:hypothetical protein